MLKWKAEGYAISANNAETTNKGTNWVLEDSSFISTKSTAFFMPGEGSIDAKGCEFYGYNMGVFLRGDNLEDKDGEDQSHARFEDCLFVKGDQTSGSEDASETSTGTVTKHYGALTIGNDSKNETGYGSIKKLVLKNCDFGVVKVANNTAAAAATVANDDVWTPATEEGNKGDLNLDLDGADSKYEAECDTTSTDKKCALDTCKHRAIVLNIYGCSDGGQECMNGTDTCTGNCGDDEWGKLELHLDDATLQNLIDHAQKFSHTTTTSDGTINPFLGCAFTDGAELKGKCCKLKIYLIDETGDAEDVELNWKAADGAELEMGD